MIFKTANSEEPIFLPISAQGKIDGIPGRLRLLSGMDHWVFVPEEKQGLPSGMAAPFRQSINSNPSVAVHVVNAIWVLNANDKFYMADPKDAILSVYALENGQYEPAFLSEA